MGRTHVALFCQYICAFNVADIVLDGAHNPDGVRAFMCEVKKNPHPKALIVNSCSDKAIEEMFPQYLQALDEDQILVVPVHSTPRACLPMDYCCRTGLPQSQACDSLLAGLERASQIVGKNGTIYLSGSLYLIGEAMSLLGEQDSIGSIFI